MDMGLTFTFFLCPLISLDAAVVVAAWFKQVTPTPKNRHVKEPPPGTSPRKGGLTPDRSTSTERRVSFRMFDLSKMAAQTPDVTSRSPVWSCARTTYGPLERDESWTPGDALKDKRDK